MAFSVLDWRKSELIWVVGVILVILGISWVQLVTGEMKTRDAQRKSDIDLVAKALRNYYDDFGAYPAATVDGKIVSCGSQGSEICEWGGSKIVDDKNIAYLNMVPADPFKYKGWNYQYELSGDKHSFKIYTSLEYKKDPGIRKDLTKECGSKVQCNWYASSD